LALDVGDSKIGVALSDPKGILASPLKIINRSNASADTGEIADIIDQYAVGRVIVGLPLSMNGSVGEQAEKVKMFVGELSHNLDIPVEFRDERLTTLSARRLMQKSGSKKSKRSRQDDDIAAALILQSYLDEQH
jgi:putative Holliday junction resolvase